MNDAFRVSNAPCNCVQCVLLLLDGGDLPRPWGFPAFVPWNDLRFSISTSYLLALHGVMRDLRMEAFTGNCRSIEDCLLNQPYSVVLRSCRPVVPCKPTIICEGPPKRRTGYRQFRLAAAQARQIHELTLNAQADAFCQVLGYAAVLFLPTDALISEPAPFVGIQTAVFITATVCYRSTLRTLLLGMGLRGCRLLMGMDGDRRCEVKEGGYKKGYEALQLLVDVITEFGTGDPLTLGTLNKR
ncbi:LOW QUALITY PROTEIN: hypothetical protein CVT26_004670 [Gymnopilus dilepis]|uniref:Uncharacterized protein n=1 Tax=Gymnopilus dilepis TaxID=231916 RepID=A0A409YJF3_9AGAR|nr:LOW QUALITY PROTEIN: hypothetical protein CVT26_004670 [Gymnopilus dilepis]